MRGSDYAELRAFAAVVEHGSFVRAAAHLGISASTLSQIVRRLEERLGTRLLNRTTRSVALSQAGARLIERLVPAIAELESSVTELAESARAPSGLVRINSSRVAAVTYLAPLLGPFLVAHPTVRLDIVTDDRLVDIVAEGFDAGIRLGEKLHRDMIALPLSGDLDMMVVASPDYLARQGRPERPHDLLGHRCLTYRRPSDDSVYRWEFERGRERVEVNVTGPILVDEPEMGTQMAVAGAGIAYQFAHQVQSHVDQGRLVPLLVDWTPAFPGFYLYFPSRRLIAPALRAFVDYVKAWNLDGTRVRG